MSTPKGIIPLLKAFQDQQITKKSFEDGIDQTIDLLQRQKLSVERTHVIAKDKEKWERVLRPGLLACFDAMIGAAEESKAYALHRDNQILHNVIFIFSQIDKADAMLRQEIGQVSKETQSVISHVLENVSADASAAKSYADSGLEPVAVKFGKA